MRKQFELPSFDAKYLETTGLAWETIVESSGRWLLLHNRLVPRGYTVEHVSVALQIPAGYPDAEIDMAYFHPDLTRSDGKPIGAADARQDLDGKSFQRWSRHRTGESAWRPGDDDISTHLVLVDDWLEREFQLR